LESTMQVTEKADFRQHARGEASQAKGPETRSPTPRLALKNPG